MQAQTVNEVGFNIESLEIAALEICKTKGMLGMLLSAVPSDVQTSYFQRLRDIGLDDELPWLQQILEEK